LAWKQDIRIMCQNRLTCLPVDLFQWHSTIKILPSVLVCNLCSPWYIWKITYLASNDNHLLIYIELIK